MEGEGVSKMIPSVPTGPQPLLPVPSIPSIPWALPGNMPFLGGVEVEWGRGGDGDTFLGSSAAGRRERGWGASSASEDCCLMKGPVVHCPATPAAPSAHSPTPKALAPQTRPCHPSPRPRLSRSPEVVPGPAGPSCCPTLAQQGPEAPWSAFWARSCLHSQPLSLPLPCPHPHPLPWLVEATAPPLMAPPGALLPGSHPSSLFPYWEPLELRTSVLGETPASPAISIPPLASRTFSGLCPQCPPPPRLCPMYPLCPS